MNTTPRRRPRGSRVAPLNLPPGRWAQLVTLLQRGDVLLRIGLALLAAVAIWGVSRAWAPPFIYRFDFVPHRDVTARVEFKRPNPEGTAEARRRAGSQTPYVYEQDPKDLVLLRADLELALKQVVEAKSFADYGAEKWNQFEPHSALDEDQNAATLEQKEEHFERFRTALGGPDGLEKTKFALGAFFEPLEKNGLLEGLPEQHGEGNRKEIFVYPIGRPTRNNQHLVQISDVLIGDGSVMQKSLQEKLEHREVADRIYWWLKGQPRLRGTLTLREDESARRREEAELEVPEEYITYKPGQILAPADKPLSLETLQLLRAEYDEQLAQLPPTRMIERSLSVLCMIFALYALCGWFIFTREPRLLTEMHRLAVLLVLAVAVVAAVHFAGGDSALAGVLPLLVFGMTFCIAYQREVALILSMSLAVILAMTSGQGLGEFIVLMGIVSSAILQLGRIRTRSKLIKVGFFSSLVAFLLTLGTGLVEHQPLGLLLLKHAGSYAMWTFLAGFLVTGMLPFIERLFGVLTEISLLELGDVSHPLLQELVRRAPGTYNHSINVASIGEAAGEAVGARGLLVRVGAYYHDIGKMLKPGYFVENQGSGGNRHDTLMPAMSTLIIIAHVKDGADLARQHRLPQPIIDLIEQHHGTTLVEYFFRRAHQQSGANPDAAELPESSFRYPGPKPQTIEAAVLMLSDAVESACRALTEPTPSRIEGVVSDISMKRLLDGQFDECGLTLEQLRTVQDSLVKSLVAVYHGRVKYPTSQPPVVQAAESSSAPAAQAS